MLTREASGTTATIVLTLFLSLGQDGSRVNGYDRRSTENRQIGYFWHVTDVFFDPLYSSISGTPDNACRAEANGTASRNHHCGYFGESEQCSPLALIDSIGKLFSTKGPADFYIFTGNIACPSSRNSEFVYENAGALIANGLESNTSILQRVYPSYGWYDYNPPGRHPMRYTRFYERMNEILRIGWPESAVLLQSRWHAGYFSRIQLPKRRIRVIVLNTNYYAKNHIASKLVDPGGQWYWLIGQLTGCRADGQRAFVVMAMPPGFDELDELDQKSLPVFHSWSTRHTERYRRIIGRYRDIIAAQFAGHRHLDTYRLVYDDDEQVVSAILVAPPVEPRFSQLPALRLYSYDTDTAEVIHMRAGNIHQPLAGYWDEFGHWDIHLRILNYVQYRFDLERANQEMDTKNPEKYWRLDYVFRELYDLPNPSPHSLVGHLARMRDAPGDYHHRFMEGRKTITDGRQRKNSSYRSMILWSSCAMANIELASFHECISAADDAASILPTPAIPAALVGLHSFYMFGR